MAEDIITNKALIGRVETLRVPSPIERLSPPLSPVEYAGTRETNTVLQGTIIALKLIQRIVRLAPVPGLHSLVAAVLNISEAVNVSFGATSRF